MQQEFMQQDQQHRSLSHFLSTSSHPSLIDLTSLLEYSEPLCLSIINNTANLDTYTFTNPFLILPIKSIATSNLNQITAIKGRITRVSSVRPELLTGVFNCRTCKALSGEIEQEFSYSQPNFCKNSLCSNRQNFDLNEKLSKFVNFQKLSIQDDSEGAEVPRVMEVILREDMVDTVRPGQKVVLLGKVILIPEVAQLMMPQNRSVMGMTGQTLENNYLGNVKNKKSVNFKDLNYKLGFLALSSDSITNSSNSITNNTNITNNNINLNTINNIKNTDNLYLKLANSLFPSITGHTSIKQSILLQLISGTSNSKTRSDINILLVGDPGTAKSQFLQQASKTLEGSVYTSGKSASAAGLTTAVVRDGNDFTVEAGALILADNRLCCIDEFDKMDPKDRVAIHEAMEQQTVTVNKAGIQCTLNARASVLAAANPRSGRYDKTKTLRQNLNLSQAIMSRFDLYFVLIDESDRENDIRIAERVLENHSLVSGGGSGSYGSNSSYSNISGGNTNNTNNTNTNNTTITNNTNTTITNNTNSNNNDELFNLSEVRNYISYCKNLQPILSAEASALLSEKFVSLRQESLLKRSNYPLCVRHLESLIRLSEALAKLHCDSVVRPIYVQEALRLFKSSIVELTQSFSINLGSENKISNSKFLKILNCFIFVLKNEGKMNSEELILYYLEQIQDEMEFEELDNEKVIAEGVLEYLCDKEGVLVKEDGGCVSVHPNYDF